jgi:hypothetical protein
MRLMPLVFCLALGVVHPSIVAEAQQAAKVYRIGVLREGPDPPSSTL